MQFLQEGARIQAQLTLSLTTLAKTKEKYEKVSVLSENKYQFSIGPPIAQCFCFKAFGASERALECYNKADADLNLSRAYVEKQRMNSNIKRQQVMTSV